MVAELKAKGLPCWICGHPINPRLDTRHRLSFTLDHVLPVSKRPDLLLDRANARPAHRACNSSKGNRTAARPQQRASRRW
jgi:5-methylcytosine-specific restriction endonuclease McrA